MAQVIPLQPTRLRRFNPGDSSTGAVVQETQYTPYGGFVSGYPKFFPIASPLKPIANRYFNGKELDTTGLYYYSARYYDPQLGRFTQADTIVQAPYNPQTLNRYSYCNNNPINLVDPSGHGWFKKWFGKIIGAIVAVFTTIVTGNMMAGFQMYNLFNSLGNAVNSGNWGGFAGGLAGGMLGGLAGVNWATSIARTLGQNTYTLGGGALIGAAEMGTAGFGGSFGEAIGSGASFGEAMKSGGIGFGIGAITGGLIEGSYLGGWQTFAHGLPVEHFVNAGILPPQPQWPQDGIGAGASSRTRVSTDDEYGWRSFLHGTNEVGAEGIRASNFKLRDGSWLTKPYAFDKLSGKPAILLNPSQYRAFTGTPGFGRGEYFALLVATSNSVQFRGYTTGGAPEWQIYGRDHIIYKGPYRNPN